MNYIREITAFNQWAADNSLSPAERIVWYALMHIANSTGWKPEFNASNTELTRLTGLSRNTIYAARERLTQRGAITIQPRPGGQSPMYSITPMTAPSPHQNGAGADDTQATETDASRTKMLQVGIDRSYQNVAGRVPKQSRSRTKTEQAEDPLVPKQSREENDARTKTEQVAYQNVAGRVPKQSTYLNNLNNLNRDTSTTTTSVRAREESSTREPTPETPADNSGMPFGLTQEEVDQSIERINRIEAAATDLGLPFRAADIQRAETLSAEYGEDWLMEALTRTGLRERRSWGTVVGILRSWREKGGIDDAFRGTTATDRNAPGQPGGQRPGNPGHHSPHAGDGERIPRTGLTATRL